MAGQPGAPIGIALVEGGAGQADHQQRAVKIGAQERGEQVQGAVIGPVDVFEEQHHGQLSRGAHKLRQVKVGAVAQLLGIYALQVGTGAEIKADQLADEMRPNGSLFGVQGAENSSHPLLKLLACGGRRIGFIDLEAKRKHVAQQAVGQTLGFGAGATLKVANGHGLQFQPVFKLIEQAGFANAGIANHCDNLMTAGRHHGLKRILQNEKFGGAANHAGTDALQTAGAHAEGPLFGAQRQISLHGFGFTLQTHRVQGLDIKYPAHQLIGFVG